MTRIRDVEARVRRVVLQAAADLPGDDVDSLLGLVEAGEQGLALEHLCTQLYEYDVPVPAALREEIAELGRAMRLDPALWQDLTA